MSQLEEQTQSAVASSTVEVKPKAVKKTKAATPKTSSTSENKPSHPKFIEMIIEGLKKLNERTGSSRQALLNFITSTYLIDSKLANQHLKLALKNGVKNGQLKQLKGVGSNGSFKIGEAAKAKKAVDTKKKVVKPASKTEEKKAPAKPKITKSKKEADDKPKKNVKKIVKPKAPKPIVEKPAANAPKKETKAKAKPAETKKPNKTVTKSEAKAKVQQKSPTAKKPSVKKLADNKKTIQKKVAKKTVKA